MRHRRRLGASRRSAHSGASHPLLTRGRAGSHRLSPGPVFPPLYFSVLTNIFCLLRGRFSDTHRKASHAFTGKGSQGGRQQQHRGCFGRGSAALVPWPLAARSTLRDPAPLRGGAATEPAAAPLMPCRGRCRPAFGATSGERGPRHW